MRSGGYGHERQNQRGHAEERAASKHGKPCGKDGRSITAINMVAGALARSSLIGKTTIFDLTGSHVHGMLRAVRPDIPSTPIEMGLVVREL